MEKSLVDESGLHLGRYCISARCISKGSTVANSGIHIIKPRDSSSKGAVTGGGITPKGASQLDNSLIIIFPNRESLEKFRHCITTSAEPGIQGSLCFSG
jgi:hypothetical protein